MQCCSAAVLQCCSVAVSQWSRCWQSVVLQAVSSSSRGGFAPGSRADPPASDKLWPSGTNRRLRSPAASMQAPHSTSRTARPACTAPAHRSAQLRHSSSRRLRSACHSDIQHNKQLNLQHGSDTTQAGRTRQTSYPSRWTRPGRILPCCDGRNLLKRFKNYFIDFWKLDSCGRGGQMRWIHRRVRRFTRQVSIYSIWL